MSIAICLLMVAPAYAKKTAYVHLFEWPWKDVAAECENFLGPAGYAAVQISPPQEHAVLPGYPWYERYQPVSYRLESRSGSREELADMILRCKAAGVDVYADVVINHMTWVNRSGQMRFGSAGSPYGEYRYPGTYDIWDFHRCGRNGDDSIQNYLDRWEVQNCNLATLADLKTESDYVRGRLAGYLNDLLALGVAGFRIDAAKHIPVADLQGILSKLSRNAYVYGEVIDMGGEPIKATEYFPLGNVTELRYGRRLAEVFKYGRLASLETFGESWGLVPSDKAVVAIDTHDSQRGHGAGGEVLNYKSGQDYVLANIFMLAWPYGYPQVMSSYDFINSDQGPPSDQTGRTKRLYTDEDSEPNCFGEWRCEHRWTQIAAMVDFRNYTDGEAKVSKWWSDGANRIAFARGQKGYVVINKDPASLIRQFDTGLPPGQYCDIVYGRVSADGKSCTGKTIEVTDKGLAMITVDPQSAVAIHGGAKL